MNRMIAQSCPPSHARRVKSFLRRVAMLGALGSMATGCTFNKLCLEGKFEGLKKGLDEVRATNAAMRMLIVHGIGDHSPGYSSNFVSQLTAELNLKRTEATQTNLTENAATNGILQVLRFNDSGGQARLHVYELTWAPTTRPLKSNAFSFDGRLDGRRSSINRKLKRLIINDGFGDAVLYLEKDFKTRMQHPITNAVRIILNDHFDTNDMVVIVTHSLGSKMTFDSINEMAGHDPEPEAGPRGKVQDLAVQTRFLIMLANQIPLLHLADPAQTNVTTTAVTNATQAPAVQKFIERRAKASKQRRRPPSPTPEVEPELRIIAVTDPNDVLSYPLRETDVRSDSIDHLAFGNVLIPNTGSFLRLFANPVRAHEGYFDNAKLRRLLIDGYDAKDHKCVKEPKPR
jgi:hypothetical protein